MDNHINGKRVCCGFFLVRTQPKAFAHRPWLPGAVDCRRSVTCNERLAFAHGQASKQADRWAEKVKHEAGAKNYVARA